MPQWPGRRTLGAIILAVALASFSVGGGALAHGQPGPDAGEDTGGDTVEIPVSFEVTNDNDSLVPCLSDGQDYTISGTLAAPAEALDDGAVTVYSHGLSYTGESFFNFQDVAGFDYIGEQAEAGHASIAVDLPGYGDSDTVPDGQMTCYGSEATMLNEVIEQLRAGDYTADGGHAPSFDDVALAGHSASGFVAQAVAYSFPESIDALITLGFADQGFTPLAAQNAAETSLICALGGEPREGAPDSTGYAFFGQTDEDFRDGHLNDTDPEVAEAATANRVQDPCGRSMSVPQNVVTDTALLATVDVPVLLVFGEEDALFDSGPGGADLQASRFVGSDDVTDVFIEDSGHALTLERTAPEMRQAVSDWLSTRGF